MDSSIRIRAAEAEAEPYVSLSFSHEDKRLTDLLVNDLTEKHITAFLHDDIEVSRRYLGYHVATPASKTSVVVPLDDTVRKSEVEYLERKLSSILHDIPTKNFNSKVKGWGAAALSKVRCSPGYTHEDKYASDKLLVQQISNEIQLVLKPEEYYAMGGSGREDVIRNRMNLSVPDESNFVDNLNGPKVAQQAKYERIDPSKLEDWSKSKIICLAETDTSGLLEEPRCPSLSCLYLDRNPMLKKLPPNFFNRMPNLRILNLSSTSIRVLPESVSKLVKLEKLFLQNCGILMELPPEIGGLKNLEELNLQNTNILYLPENVKKLTKLTHLNISFAEYIDEDPEEESTRLIPSQVISNLQNLKELNINVDPKDKRWENFVGELIEDVCKLQHLNMLTFYFPTIPDLCKFMQLRSAMKTNSPLSFRFVVGQHAKRILVRIPSKVELELQGHSNHLHYVNGVSLPEVIKLLLRFTASFYLDRHYTVKKLSDFGVTNMKKLRYCVVGECNELQVIIDGEDVEDQKVLNSLEYLCVCCMKNLESFWKGPVQEECFSQLKSLTFRVCPKLTTIFTPMLLIKLVQLEELHIEACTELQRIVVKPDGFVGSIDTIYLPQLKKMSLNYLPELVGISAVSEEHPDLELDLELGQRVESMSIYGCPELKNIESLVVPNAYLTKVTCERSWWDALEWNKVPRPNKLFVPIDDSTIE